MTKQDITIASSFPPAGSDDAHGCTCCAPAAASSGAAEGASWRGSDSQGSGTEEKTAVAAVTTYKVEGMTCGHCVSAVSSELSNISGVRDVAVELVAGGASTVTVISDQPLTMEEVRAAVDEAGYTLTDA